MVTSHRLDPDLVARIASLSFRSRHLIEGSLTGLHRSPHRGSSVEFAEHKEYAPGDNLRHLDWRVFAKSDKYYVKQFEEETNLRATLIVDGSASMAYASSTARAGSKYDFAVQLVSGFAFLLLRQQDAVGLVVTRGNDISSVPPRTRSTHLRAILDLLGRSTPAGATDLASVIRHRLESMGRRGLVLLASDLLDQADPLPGLLAQLRRRGHDVIVFHTLDPAELTFPFDAPLLMESMEDDRRILVEPLALRAAYQRELAAFTSKWRKWAIESDIDYVLADTSRSPGETLVSFLLSRDAARGPS